MLSGSGLCDELITCPEESYRLWCVVVCDQETTEILVNEEAKAHYKAIAPRQTDRQREREREELYITVNYMKTLSVAKQCL